MAGKKAVRGWMTKLHGMPASYELNEEEVRGGVGVGWWVGWVGQGAGRSSSDSGSVARASLHWPCRLQHCVPSAPSLPYSCALVPLHAAGAAAAV